MKKVKIIVPWLLSGIPLRSYYQLRSSLGPALPGRLVFSEPPNGQKKQSAIITPDTWRDPSRAPPLPPANKLLSKKPHYVCNKCRLCAAQITHANYNYCQNCAYLKGICGMCGVKLYDVSLHRQRDV